MYASDYPHWDMDLPSTIYDLPFLSEKAKHNILGGTAAKLLGITTHLDCYPAEGLGGLTRGVTPLEMAGAYATLASGGVRHRPTGIERVVFPDGKSEDLAGSQGKRVLTDGEAYEVTGSFLACIVFTICCDSASFTRGSFLPWTTMSGAIMRSALWMGLMDRRKSPSRSREPYSGSRSALSDVWRGPVRENEVLRSDRVTQRCLEALHVAGAARNRIGLEDHVVAA